jgi:hypothetical protein
MMRKCHCNKNQITMNQIHENTKILDLDVDVIGDKVRDKSIFLSDHVSNWILDL